MEVFDAFCHPHGGVVTNVVSDHRPPEAYAILRLAKSGLFHSLASNKLQHSFTPQTYALIAVPLCL